MSFLFGKITFVRGYMYVMLVSGRVKKTKHFSQVTVFNMPEGVVVVVPPLKAPN